MLRELIPDEDAVQIDDGAQMWNASALVDATREHDDGTVHDLAVNDEGIARVRPDGVQESVRIYRVRPRPTLERLVAELREHGVPEQRVQDMLRQGVLRCAGCGRLVEIVEVDEGTVWLACPTTWGGDHADFRIDW